MAGADPSLAIPGLCIDRQAPQGWRACGLCSRAGHPSPRCPNQTCLSAPFWRVNQHGVVLLGFPPLRLFREVHLERMQRRGKQRERDERDHKDLSAVPWALVVPFVLVLPEKKEAGDVAA